MSDTPNSFRAAQQIHELLKTNQGEIESFIRALVETESPSGDEAGSRAVVDLLADAARMIGCVSEIKRVDVPDFGQHLVIQAFAQQRSEGQILVVGHTDTVHARGSVEARPWRREAGKIYGPGIFDMKANCALVLAVLRAMSELRIVPRCAITVALTCDEEVGSFTGWPLLEETAKSANTRCAFVMEPPAPGGRVKTGRKGTGIYAMKVEGKAAHAGLEPEKGASAILELARQTERLHTMNGSGSGITVNVGVVRGGTRSNVVAAEAEADIDVRFSTEAESREIERIFRNVTPIDERTKVFVSGGINRPPLERTPAVIELFEKARAIAAQVDFDLGEAQVGGASDGNFIAALGIPVLDGLGISGDGAHAVHEHIEADDLARRGALIGGLLISN
ncbi:MAG TPA: M20 family metallopeptidase [Pyrinomonadaceae bacterium]|jgi:glutamate carboxypeptidase|nr:M20 family metallopeptidase [Pyrinomonadaceae bacterium]